MEAGGGCVTAGARVGTGTGAGKVRADCACLSVLVAILDGATFVMSRNGAELLEGQAVERLDPKFKDFVLGPTAVLGRVALPAVGEERPVQAVRVLEVEHAFSEPVGRVAELLRELRASRVNRRWDGSVFFGSRVA